MPQWSPPIPCRSCGPTIVLPMLPSAALIAATSTWTASGCREPATMRPLALRRHEIFRAILDPVRIELDRRGGNGLDHSIQPRVVRGTGDLRRQRERESPDLTGRQTQAMIRHAAGHRVAVLDHIQPVHLRVWPRDLAARRKGADVRDVAIASQEITVQRQNDVCLVKLRQRFHTLAISLVGSHRTQRLIHRPRGFRILLPDQALQTQAGRRIIVLQQEGQPGTVAGTLENFISAVVNAASSTTTPSA